MHENSFQIGFDPNIDNRPTSPFKPYEVMDKDYYERQKQKELEKNDYKEMLK